MAFFAILIAVLTTELFKVFWRTYFPATGGYQQGLRICPQRNITPHPGGSTARGAAVLDFWPFQPIKRSHGGPQMPACHQVSGFNCELFLNGRNIFCKVEVWGNRRTPFFSKSSKHNGIFLKKQSQVGEKLSNSISP